MWKQLAGQRGTGLLLAVLALVVTGCSGDASPTTVVPATTIAVPATTPPVVSTTSTTEPPPTTTTTTTSTTTTTLPATSSTVAGSTDTVPTTIATDIDYSDPCAVFALFVDAVAVSDYGLAFALVHPYAKGQPPLGSESGLDRFSSAEDPAFASYALDVSTAPPDDCRFLAFGESFGDPIGAVLVTTTGALKATAMRGDQGEWRIDELSDHVKSVSPPPDSVQPSFAEVVFTTPIGTFDERLQVDGEDVFDYQTQESLTDPELVEISYAPTTGFAPGEHIAILMSVLETGLLDAEAISWRVP